MKATFQVEVLGFPRIREIQDTRTKDDFLALLETLKFSDVSELSDDDLRETCIMALQDLEPVEATYVVLTHDMAGSLREGQLRNIANEMLDEKLWEEYADTSFHERLFNTGSLLYSAFPQSFPETDAVHILLEVTAENAAARGLLTESLNEAFLARLLADGMDDGAVLHRLYAKELAGNSFANAGEAVWNVRNEIASTGVMKIEVIGSGYWPHVDPASA
jgi:hypothetical protein